MRSALAGVGGDGRRPAGLVPSGRSCGDRPQDTTHVRHRPGNPAHSPRPGYPDAGRPARPMARRWPLRRFSGWLVALGVVVLAGIVILVTGTRPGYDPYGWLDWGYQTWHGSLNLGGAPSWKPFTYLFDVPFALFGHYALWLWMLTAVSISLAGASVRGPDRLPADGPGRWPTDSPRWAPIVAAVFAGAFGARHPGVLPLPALRPVGSDAGHRLPGRDRLLSVRSSALGLVAGCVGRTGPARGVAVRRPVRDVVVVQGALYALDAGRRRARQRLFVVRRARRSPTAVPISPASWP